MTTRLLAAFAVALTAGVAGIVGAAAAAGGPTPPQIEAMIDSPATEQVVTPPHRISAVEALRALTPADIAPGLTMRQAVGLDPLPAWFVQQETAGRTTAAHRQTSGRRSLAYTSGTVYCWAGSKGGTWGTWPYQQTVNDHASWCAHYQWAMTAFSHSVTLNATLCGPNGTFGYTTDGFPLWSAPYTTFVSGGYFTCPVSGIYSLHLTRSMKLQVNSYGNYWIVSTS
jgi:hypothetical protein